VQHPLGHEVASQTHLPVPSHSRPVAQALQATPEAPHEALVSFAGVSHVPLAVQQPGHDVPAHVQAPDEHASPVPHALQAAPPVPHAAPDWALEPASRHVPVAVQHPPEHEVESQAHVPVLLSQYWPMAHAAQLAPAAPQLVAVSEENTTHMSAASQHPLRHVVGPQVGASGATSAFTSAPPLSVTVASPESLLESVDVSPPAEESALSVVASPLPPPSPPSQSPPLHSPLENDPRPSRDPHAAVPALSSNRAVMATRPRTYLGYGHIDAATRNHCPGRYPTSVLSCPSSLHGTHST